ncbi:MAG TPA: tRNA-dihydrouridine synthase [Bacteroides sp.]|nr:tRNA-dihydrouridine synthase [Bacteroides sp.]
MNFWRQLPKPFFALAPMEDVTDTVFRELIASISSPDKLHVVFTEFMSVEGFLHDRGKEKVSHRLFVSRKEREILKARGIKLVAQIWGSDPEMFLNSSRLIVDQYEFDGIDINMGCPVKKIVKKSACSALIKSPELAREIVIATKEGSGLPVSVKTRIGFNEVETENWIGKLLGVNPAAITIHGRTQKMRSKGLADWNEVLKAVQLRDSLNSDTLILGNGDVSNYKEGLDRSATFRTDGIMVGRGIFGNPAFFADSEITDLHQRIQLLKKHLIHFADEWEGMKSYSLLKRFFKIYIHSFQDATSLRARLMNTNNYHEGMQVIEEFEATF